MQRQTFQRQHQVRHHDRTGSLTLVIAISLLVVMAAVALVLDRLWLDAADRELVSAVEAAALGAAGELASDDLYRTEESDQRILDRARETAIRIAAENFVAGRSVELGTEPDEIRFGRLVHQSDTTAVKFLETDFRPTTVVVEAARSRAKNNPVALFLQDVTGVSSGDLRSRAEATIDPHVVGFRIAGGVRLPFLPFAMRVRTLPQCLPASDWSELAGRSSNDDIWSYDEAEGRVISGSDGIPEFRIRSAPFRSPPEDASLALMEFGVGDFFDRYRVQILRGLDDQDLDSAGGELNFTHGPFWFPGGLTVSTDLIRILKQQLGVPRLVLLYDQHEVSGPFSHGRVHCVGFAAVRLVDIIAMPGNAVEFVLQPCVLTTRTAILASELDEPLPEPWTWPKQPAIFKLQVTY